MRRSIQAFFQSAVEDVRKAVEACALRKTESEEGLRERISRLDEQRRGISQILAELEDIRAKSQGSVHGY